MANEILETIAKDIHEIDAIIVEAKELISAAKEAGEDVHQMQSDLNLLEVRKTKWERMLSARGL